MDKSDIRERTYKFALRIIKLTQKLPKNIAGDSLGRQLIRSGTSIGSNIEEAQGAFSKKDFTYKMSLARKEAHESKYWLNLIKDSNLMSDQEVDLLIQEADELAKILTSIVKTSEESLRKTRNS
ncbi:MAG: four helix bundle protein [Candidatus Hodarchaeota archaeon]